ncbi:MAG: peptidoglycan editing factor PgeF [Actinobacteria bacterium]|nr:peptidoglycan editing factor PgeF [Actinomycetota bacterium]
MAQLIFTARAGGSSTVDYSSLNLGDHVGDDRDLVAQNREALRKLVSEERLVFMNQVHGDTVIEVDESVNSPVTADAIITRTPGLPLVVLVADCLPILISSPSVVGAVHAGRKGVLNGIISKTVSAMRALGAKDLEAKIGPAICKACYEVDLEMYKAAIEQKPELSTTLSSHRLDLTRAAKFELESAGVKVSTLDICTAHNANYFSYRRDGQTGRSAGVIVL